ncbi:MAG: hypothetical protein IPM59_15425 [Chloracidobacterium sp.]|nr:hypothetical protein [Chloracidobacterium sp.]
MQAVIDLVNAAYRMKGGKGDAGAIILRPLRRKCLDVQLDSGKIETVEKGVISTNSDLTNKPVSEVHMAKQSLPLSKTTLKSCPISDCGQNVYRRLKWCRKHYDRWRKYGDPLFVKMSRTDPESNFWRHVDKTEGDCWFWTAARDRKGYGVGNWSGRRKRATHISYFIANGRWPKMCRHTCDNPPCVNPEHLLDGTHLDNVRDMVSRGRQAIGEGNGTARLTVAKVREIKSMLAGGATLVATAARFGVCKKTIWNIKKGRYWRHVT